MSDLQILKERIYHDEKIEVLLEELGCEPSEIRKEQGGTLVVSPLPSSFNSHNKRAIQVKNNENLTSYIRNRDINGDIFSVIGYILYNVTTFEELRGYLHQIKTWICNTLEYDDVLNFKVERENKVDWIGWLKDIKRKRKSMEHIIGENKVLSESILDEYIKLPHIKFYEDGIKPSTQEEFQIGFDLRSERIVFPVRNKDGQLIGVKGRYAGDNFEIDDNFKYVYVHPCDKSIELFNLHRALPYIKEKNEVIVIEGAKSCMLLYQWGIKNCVSIEGKGLSPVQVKLLKDLEVDITFCWDKDVDEEFIKRQISQIKSRTVYVVFDTKEYLENHQSPVDKGRDTWYSLYRDCKYRVN